MARILYAEDDFGIRLSAKLSLNARGHEVTAVEDGRCAIEALKDQVAFDVLLTDNSMPKASGQDVITAAQELNKLPKVTILWTGDKNAEAIVVPEGVTVLHKAEHDLSSVCKIIHERLGIALHPLDL